MDAGTIGRKLYNLRGKTPQAIVANAVGITISALSMYESGNRIPRDEVKIKLAKYYGKSVQELFYDN